METDKESDLTESDSVWYKVFVNIKTDKETDLTESDSIR